MSEKNFTIKIGDFTTVAKGEWLTPNEDDQRIKDFMTRMTDEIHQSMFIGMDFGTETSTAVATTLTIADLARGMEALGFKVPAKSAPKIKDEFKSWPYGADD